MAELRETWKRMMKIRKATMRTMGPGAAAVPKRPIRQIVARYTPTVVCCSALGYTKPLVSTFELLTNSIL